MSDSGLALGSGTSVLAKRGVTRKEAEVLDALRERLTNAEIAARLYVSERTVESHVSSLLRKLQAGNRRELARVARSLGSPGRLGVPRLPAALELLAESGPLIDRQRELHRLVELWELARAGRTLVAVVCGEAGIGKSRLVAELAAEAHRGGAAVLLGSCFEDVQTPYLPFVQALTDDLVDLADGEVRRRVGHDGRALERLVPTLAPTLRGTGSLEFVDARAERAELLTALHGYFTRAAQAAPLLLVLEDLHWATSTARDTVVHLARVAGRASLLVVTTSRNTPPDLGDDLSVFLADLARYPSVRRLELGGLDRQEVHALVGSLAAGGSQRNDIDADVIHAETGGNPLLARELASTPPAPGRRAGSLRGLLSRRYQRLSDGDIALLDLAVVVGPEFDADLVATAGDTGLAHVLETLERAEAAGLVAAAPGRPGRFTFVHALFRSVRYDTLPLSRQLRLHRDLARALQPHADNERVLSELARHAYIAAPLGDVHSALEFNRRAGETARRLLAFDEAASHYRQALEMAELQDPSDPHLRLSLRIDLGAALLHGGHPAGRSMMLTAADEARALGDPDALANAALLLQPAGTTLTTGGYVDDEVAAVFQDALDSVGPAPSATRARLLAGLASELQAADLDHSRALAREAIALARSLGDQRTVGHVLLPYRQLIYEPACTDERRAVLEEVVALGRRLDEPRLTGIGLWSLCALYREMGDLHRSARLYAELEAVFGDQRPTWVRAGLATTEATRQYLEGNLAGAEATAETLLSLAPEAGYDAVNFYVPQLLVIRLQQGRIADVVATLEQAVQAQPGHRLYTALLAAALARTGHRADAMELLAALAAHDYDMPRNVNWFTGTVGLADAVELLGDRAAAGVLSKRLQPFAGRIADHIVGVSWPADHALAQLALTLGDLPGAAAAAARAVEASRRRGTPVFLARELILLGAAHARAGHAQSKITPLVDEAIQIAAATGALLIDQEAKRYGLTAIS